MFRHLPNSRLLPIGKHGAFNSDDIVNNYFFDSINLNGILSVFKPSLRITNPFVYNLHTKLWSAYCKSHPISFGSEGAQRNASKRHILSVLGKIGHGGTLDPMAQGIVVVGLGSGTKKLGTLLQGPKSYTAIMKLGEGTDTLDATGNIVDRSESLSRDIFDPTRLQDVVRKFIGHNILQVPPKYSLFISYRPRFSALRVNGTRACDLMRRGIEIPDLDARPVTINSISIVNVDPPFITLSVDCMGGTYIRSLVRDISAELGTFGMLTFLERTRIGPFHIQDSIRDLSIFEHDLEAVRKISEQGALLLDEYIYSRQHTNVTI